MPTPHRNGHVRRNNGLTREQREFKRKERSLMAYFIRNSKVAYVFAAILIIWGLITTAIIPKESAPFIEFGTVNISTVYSGVSALDMDSLVTQKIESKVKSIKGVSSMTSSSRNSASSVSLQFEPGQDMMRALSDIRSKVDEVKPSLPTDIDSGPTITEVDSSLQPFLTVALTSPEADAVMMRDMGETLKDRLEGISEVAKVTVSGGAEREIVVDLKPDRLNHFGISADEVISRVRSAHRDVPLGELEINSLDYTVRFQGRYQNLEDIKNLDVRDQNAAVQPGAGNAFSPVALVKVGDVADVYEQGKEESNVERIGLKDDEFFGDALFLRLSKNGGTNIFNADSKAKSTVEAFIEDLPYEVNINYSREVAETIKEDYSLVINSAVTAVVIVLLLIFVFVGFKEGLIAGLVIPITFLVTIGVLNVIGFTLSFMTNFSMILALGILVDTAIVVVEGCHDYVKKGYSPYKAAILALHEYRQPLISGTLTTLAVFIPLFVLPGVLGKYLSFIPVTVFIVLVAALLISLLLITAFAGQWLKKPSKPLEERNAAAQFAARMRQRYDRFQNSIIRGYGRFTARILQRRWLRIGMIYGILVLFLLSWLIPIPFELFPESDSNFLSVSIEKEEGAVVEETKKVAVEVEKILLELPETKLVTTSLNGNSGSFLIELISQDERKAKKLRTSIDLSFDLKNEFKDFEGDAEVRVQNVAQGPPSLAPVAFRVIAVDNTVLDEAQTVLAEFKELLKEIPGTSAVRDDVEMIPGELRYRVNRDRALAYGVDPDVVPQAVRTALQGTTAAVITREGRDIDVVVRYDQDRVDSVDRIDEILIATRSGARIPLKQVVDYQMVPGLSSISRVDTNIAFTLLSDLTEEGNAAEITAAFFEKIKDYDFPAGITIKDAGENEENAELFAAMGGAFVIAMLIMFLILVIQFNSYIQPFIILSTILFAMIGVSGGLYITGTPRSLAFILGVISLAGIVVNDAIILIDQINKKVSEQKDDDDMRIAIVEAGMSRFNPIILTTLTTTAGIVPLVFVDTFWAGLSYTVIFGLMVASFLTLVVTPIMYLQFEKEKVVTMLPLVILIAIGVGVAQAMGGNIVPALVALGVVIILSLLWKRSYRKLA